MYEVKENFTVSIQRHTFTAVIHDETCWCAVINIVCLQHHRHATFSNSTLVLITRNEPVDKKKIKKPSLYS